MSGEVLTLPSFGKINLHLQVIGRRPDGFHDLCTVFQTVSLHDTITVSPYDAIELTCSDPSIPIGDRNILVRAASALRVACGTTGGAKIYLEKRIPAPGGLGGGSSNAALVLLAGYADLARGGETLAPILLIIGYCVLVPLAILK